MVTQEEQIIIESRPIPFLFVKTTLVAADLLTNIRIEGIFPWD